MPCLIQTEKVRLFLVAERPNENGVYALEPFENADCDDDLDLEEIDAWLDYLVDRFYGGGTYFEVVEVSESTLSISFDNFGNVRILYNGDVIKIPDIIDKIDADPNSSKFYVLVDRDFSEYRWVVAETRGVAYSG